MIAVVSHSQCCAPIHSLARTPSLESPGGHRRLNRFDVTIEKGSESIAVIKVVDVAAARSSIGRFGNVFLPVRFGEQAKSIDRPQDLGGVADAAHFDESAPGNELGVET